MVCTHLESYKQVESHFCHSTTKETYTVDSTHIIAFMPCDFIKKCDENSELPKISQSTFRTIFNEERNISFHCPKKHLCGFCATVHNTLPDISEEFNMHILNKDKIRMEMQADNASKNPIMTCDSFDLQNT